MVGWCSMGTFNDPCHPIKSYWLHGNGVQLLQDSVARLQGRGDVNDQLDRSLRSRGVTTSVSAVKAWWIHDMGVSENRLNPETQWFCWSLSLLNGYFIGKINPIFRQSHINHLSGESLLNILISFYILKLESGNSWWSWLMAGISVNAKLMAGYEPRGRPAWQAEKRQENQYKKINLIRFYKYHIISWQILPSGNLT